MTKLLELAVEAARALPPELQDDIQESYGFSAEAPNKLRILTQETCFPTFAHVKIM